MSNHGCVTNFTTSDGRRITVWRHTNDAGENRFSFLNGEPFDPLPNDPALAQAIGAELYRLGSEVGRLRRAEHERLIAEVKANAALLDLITSLRPGQVTGLALSTSVLANLSLRPPILPSTGEPDRMGGFPFQVNPELPDGVVLLLRGDRPVGMIRGGKMTLWDGPHGR